MRAIHRAPRPGSARDRHRDALAQRHVMGLLTPTAERAFRAWMSQDARLQAQVRACEHTLAQLSMCVPPMAPSIDLWRRIQKALPREERRVADPSEPWWRRLLDSLMLPMISMACIGALAFAALAPAMWPTTHEDDIPPSYVGVLVDRQDQAALVVASRQHGRQLQVKLLRPIMPPPGQAPVLWLLAPGEPPRALAWLPLQGRANLPMPSSAETAFSRVTRLAVTLERSAPTSEAVFPKAPTTTSLLSGHCAKVW